MLCAHCGADNREDAKRCTACLRPFDHRTNDPVVDEPNSDAVELPSFLSVPETTELEVPSSDAEPETATPSGADVGPAQTADEPPTADIDVSEVEDLLHTTPFPDSVDAEVAESQAYSESQPIGAESVGFGALRPVTDVHDDVPPVGDVPLGRNSRPMDSVAVPEETLRPTDPRLKVVAAKRKSNWPLVFIPIGLVCGLCGVLGILAGASGLLPMAGSFLAGDLTPPASESPVLVAVGTVTPRVVPADTPMAVTTPVPGTSPQAPTATRPAAASTPSSTAPAATPATGQPTAVSGTPVADTATPTSAPAVATPTKERRNTSATVYNQGETAWRDGAGLTLQRTEGGIGTIANPSARLTAGFVFENDRGEPISIGLSSGNFRVVVKGDVWNASGLSPTSFTTADGASQGVNASFVGTGNLLKYSDVTTVDIVVVKFGPIENITFRARFR